MPLQYQFSDYLPGTGDCPGQCPPSVKLPMNLALDGTWLCYAVMKFDEMFKADWGRHRK